VLMGAKELSIPFGVASSNLASVGFFAREALLHASRVTPHQEIVPFDG
jgi:hypothetical protein